MSRFIIPLIWFGVAVGVYMYNQGTEGKVVMFGLEYLVGDNLTDRGNATVALAVFIGVVTSVGPIAALFRKDADDSADEE